jgi:uncharacterized protein YndB with AHSA1/START domain
MSDDHAIDAKLDYSIEINAAPASVWNALTNPAALKRWMLDTGLEVLADWQENGAIVFRGVLNGYRFENHGTIRAFKPETAFEYDYWSTLSRSKVPDRPENYTTVRFELEEMSEGTKLTVRLSGFPDESTSRHVRFYWNGTLPVLKRFCEESTEV